MMYCCIMILIFITDWEEDEEECIPCYFSDYDTDLEVALDGHGEIAATNTSVTEGIIHKKIVKIAS